MGVAEPNEVWKANPAADNMFVEISNEAGTARIALLGGELRSLIPPGGVELLWQGAKDSWQSTSPLLFPLIGTASPFKVRYRDQEHEMPPHGFTGSHIFEVVSQTSHSCHLRLCAADTTMAVYPYRFELSVHYELIESALKVTAVVTNSDSVPMPYAFGFHPGLQLCGGSCVLELEHAEADWVLEVRRSSDLDATGRQVRSPFDRRKLALSPDLFEHGAFVIPNVKSRTVIVHRQDLPPVSINFSNLDHLAFWSVPGASFVCVEPWSGLPASLVEDYDLDRSGGISRQLPGTSSTHSMTISLPPKDVRNRGDGPVAHYTASPESDTPIFGGSSDG